MPFEFQPLHLLVIGVIALLIFGPSRLPEIGRGLGQAINEFRNGVQGLVGDVHDGVQAADLPPTSAPRSGPPAPAGQFCIQCGAPNPAEARFCNHCGAAMPR